jgi:hypothetical protein
MPSGGDENKAGPRNLIEILRKQRLPAYDYGGSGHAEPRNAAHGAVSMAASAISGLMWRHACTIDHDPIALAVLVIGIGIVVLFALSI